jgi:hypothetical protein
VRSDCGAVETSDPAQRPRHSRLWAAAAFRHWGRLGRRTAAHKGNTRSREWMSAVPALHRTLRFGAKRSVSYAAANTLGTQHVVCCDPQRGHTLSLHACLKRQARVRRMVPAASSKTPGQNGGSRVQLRRGYVFGKHWGSGTCIAVGLLHACAATRAAPAIRCDPPLPVSQLRAAELSLGDPQEAGRCSGQGSQSLAEGPLPRVQEVEVWPRPQVGFPSQVQAGAAWLRQAQAAAVLCPRVAELWLHLLGPAAVVSQPCL